mmetsp:Transcript_28695/g.61977  ORF Transcript_28695/g.61977 Transcript_28695/m.61977 type:complete len:242 (-) Transcript_28695:87-812(-)
MDVPLAPVDVSGSMMSVASVVDSTALRSARAPCLREKVQVSPCADQPPKKRPELVARTASPSISTRKPPPTRLRIAARLGGVMVSLVRNSEATVMVVNVPVLTCASYTTLSDLSPKCTMRTLPATAVTTRSNKTVRPPWARISAGLYSPPDAGNRSSDLGATPPVSQKFHWLGAERPGKTRPSIEVMGGTSKVNPKLSTSRGTAETGMVRVLPPDTDVALTTDAASMVSNATSTPSSPPKP